MVQIRAFIAIELPIEVKTALKQIQSALKKTGNNPVKWVDPANIHLTLKFLGNIETSQVPTITTVMESTANNTRPFPLQTQTPGAFPNINRVQVLWVGLGGDLDVLLNLQNTLDFNLSKLGYAPEKHPFSPHLTIGRVRETATLIEKQNLGRYVASARQEQSVTFSVQSMDLMQSQLLPSGPKYTCLKSVVL
jgi:2'-5' RNA ligase